MKILYVASDGKAFETAAECTRHERELAEKKKEEKK